MAEIRAARPYVEPAAVPQVAMPVSPGVAVEPAPPPDATPEELLHWLRTYAAWLLAALALAVAANLALLLYRRWRRDNVSPAPALPADRRSIRRRKVLI